MLECKGAKQGVQAKSDESIYTNSPHKLFDLLETKMKAANIGELYLRLCSGWNFTTNIISCCKSGRIILAWDPGSFLVDIIFMSDKIIHCMLTAMLAPLSLLLFYLRF